MDVNVLFIDASTRQPIGHSVMPADQLPDSFAAATTLHLADQQWQVEQAEPVTRAEFQQTRTLRLTLRKIQHLQPDEILYSLPTICDALPPQVHPGGLPDQRAFTLHEDLWRDVELLACDQQAQVDANFAAIRQAHQTRAGPSGGFRSLHVRCEPRALLGGKRLTTGDIVAAFGPRATALDGVWLRDPARLVLSGFAMRCESGLVASGYAQEGRVIVLGLDPWALEGDPTAEAQAVARLMERNALTLVVWRQCRQLVDGEKIAAWLASIARTEDAPGGS
jgi:hypothetical protein